MNEAEQLTVSAVNSPVAAIRLVGGFEFISAQRRSRCDHQSQRLAPGPVPAKHVDLYDGLLLPAVGGRCAHCQSLVVLAKDSPKAYQLFLPRVLPQRRAKFWAWPVVV